MRMLKIMIIVAVCGGFATASGAVTINEWVSNDLSTDTHEFVELCGDPGEPLDDLTIVIIEGEGSGSGTIDRIWPLAGYSIGAAGFFVIGDAAVNPDLEKTESIENGGNNILLMSNYDAEQFPLGTDIDEENDCIADFSIGTVVDGVGYGYGYGALDCAYYYGIPTVGPDGTYDPAGGARCADCTGEWYMICINGTEPAPTGTGCSEDDGYFVDWATPGGPNGCSPVSNEDSSWGSIKAMYR